MRRLVVAPLLALVAAAAGSAPARAGAPADLVSQAEMEAHVAALTALERWTGDGQAAARAYVIEKLEASGYVPSVDAHGNVVAEQIGAETPERVLVLGAHYDAFVGTPGADDNASGVAGLLEVARVLTLTPPKSTVLLVAFADEELGLVGSGLFVDDLVTAGVDVAAGIVFEMIGFTREPGNQFVFPNVAGCFQVSGTEDQPLADWIGIVGNEEGLILSLARAADVRVPELHVEWGLLLDGTGDCLPDTRRSDHAHFWEQGWPAVMLTDTANFRNPNYHEPTDTADTLDYPFARNVAAATAAFLVEEPVPAPEPGAMGLLAVGGLVLAGAGRLGLGRAAQGARRSSRITRSSSSARR